MPDQLSHLGVAGRRARQRILKDAQKLALRALAAQHEAHDPRRVGQAKVVVERRHHAHAPQVGVADAVARVDSPIGVRVHLRVLVRGDRVAEQRDEIGEQQRDSLSVALWIARFVRLRSTEKWRGCRHARQGAPRRRPCPPSSGMATTRTCRSRRHARGEVLASESPTKTPGSDRTPSTRTGVRRGRSQQADAWREGEQQPRRADQQQRVGQDGDKVGAPVAEAEMPMVHLQRAGVSASASSSCWTWCSSSDFASNCVAVVPASPSHALSSTSLERCALIASLQAARASKGEKLTECLFSMVTRGARGACLHQILHRRAILAEHRHGIGVIIDHHWAACDSDLPRRWAFLKDRRAGRFVQARLASGERSLRV